MAKRTHTAAEAAAALTGDPGAKTSVEEEILRGKLVTVLVQLRAQKKITQKQIAKKMGCDPSKISRIEGGGDTTLSWGDIVSYVEALDVKMHVLFADRSLPAAHQIKQHVLQIGELLTELTELAKQVGDDHDLVSKIHQFNGEVLFNFLTRFEENYRELAPIVKVSPSTIEEPDKPSEVERKSSSKLAATT